MGERQNRNPVGALEVRVPVDVEVQEGFQLRSISGRCQVVEGQSVATLESTKLVLEVESPATGLFEPRRKTGERVECGVLLGFLLEASSVGPRAQSAPVYSNRVSNSARVLMAEHGLLEGDFQGGLITKGRVEDFLQERGKKG